MLINVPWIRSRRFTLIFALIDFSIVYFIFNNLHEFQYSANPSIKIKIFVSLFWIIISYVFGRYSKHRQTSAGLIKNLFIKIFVIWLITNFIYLAINLSFSFITFLFSLNSINNSLEREQIQFFLKTSTIFSLASFLVNILILYIKKLIFTDNKVWFFLGSEVVFDNFLIALHLRSKDYKFKRISNLSDISDKDIYKAKGIIISDVESNLNESLEKLNYIRKNEVVITSLLDWYESYLFRIPPEFMESDFRTINKFFNTKKNYQHRIKRLGDIFVSSLLIFFSSPILLLVVLLIFLEDRGPILYSQIRNGFNGNKFKIVKFRSMHVDAEKNGAQWAENCDPRITKIGKIIRATRIDELPQLFCVLNGRMSLIGPRPERPEIEEKLIKHIPYYKLRENVIPGISGWAQVNYPYGASVLDSRMKLSYDLYYLSNFSIFFDFLILIKTIKIVFNAKGSRPFSKINNSSF